MELKLAGINRNKFSLRYSDLVDIRLAGRSDVLLYLAERTLAGDTKITYDEIAKACGYKDRSGAYKAVKKLCKNLILIETFSGAVYWNVGEFNISNA